MFREFVAKVRENSEQSREMLRDVSKRCRKLLEFHNIPLTSGLFLIRYVSADPVGPAAF